MMHTAELGSALRYRYRSLLAVFLLVTCCSWWLFARHAAQGVGPSIVAIPQAAAAQPGQLVAPTAAQSASAVPIALANSGSPDAPLTEGFAATRNPARIRQLRTSLSEAMERKNTAESRLAELAMPAAPIVRQSPSIATVSPELRAATARLAAAKANLTELQTRYTDAYPDVVQAKDELTEAEGAMYAARHQTAAAPAKAHLVAPSSASPQVEAERASLRAELAEVEATIPSLRAELDAASAVRRRSVTAAPARKDGYWPLVLPKPAGEATSSVAPPVTRAAVSLAPQAAPARLLSAHSLLFLPQSMLLGLLASGIVFAMCEGLDQTIKGPQSLAAALPAEARRLSLRSMRA